ncbi:MAG: hypothetical protein ACI909_003126 [Planctomycetota bacterium]|jgi:hypothetical protein
MSKVSDADIQELLDRQKCYDVLTRYCRALDRSDAGLMRSVYWEDGMDDHGVFDGNAHEFADFIVREIKVWFEVTMHSISNVHMEYYGDTMCTESYLIAYHKVRAEKEKVLAVQGPSYWEGLKGVDAEAKHHVFLYGGRYIDRLEKRDGEWRIALRQVCMDWNENFAGNTILDEGMFATLTRRGCHGLEDPVYQNKP